MHCYYHQDVEAVGLCKSCSRGLCAACAADVGNGLACRGRCEEEVKAVNRVIGRNKTAYEKTSGAYARVGAFYAIVGAAFLAAGVLDWRGMAWILIPAGGIFLLSALLHFVTGRKYQRE